MLYHFVKRGHTKRNTWAAFDGWELHRHTAKMDRITATAKGSSAPVPTVSRYLPTVAKTGTVDTMCIPTLDVAIRAALASEPALPE